LGKNSASATAQLHPLTPKAAGLMLGEPKMGRSVPPGTTSRNVGVGQRVYHLSIPGRRLLTVPGRDGKPRVRRLGGVRVHIDSAKNEIRVCVFLSEARAQRVAVRLRRQTHPGAVAASLQRYVMKRLLPILRGERPRRIHIVQPGLPASEALGAALKRLPPDVVSALAERIRECVVTSMADFVKTQSRTIVQASEAPADGITLQFHIVKPPALKELTGALLPTGATAGLADAIRRGPKPEVRLVVHAGYKCD
jgi:hypothetical protein